MSTRRISPFAVFFVALLILHLLLICSMRIYPFTDLPFHLAAATIFRYYGEPTNQFAAYYSIRTLLETHIAHMVFCALPVFPSVEFGNRAFYALYVLLLPVSVLLTVRRLGGNRWASLLSFVLLYEWNVTWGFAEFNIAVPFVLLLFCLTVDSLEQGRVANRVIAALVCCALFFMHLVALLFALLIVGVCCLYRRRSSRRRALEGSTVVVPSLVLVWMWLRTSDSRVGSGLLLFLTRYYQYDYLRKGATEFVNRAQLLLLSGNYALAPWWTSKYKTPLLFSLMLVAPLLWCLLRRRRPATQEENRKLAYGALFFLCALVCYFVLPDAMEETAWLYQRLGVFVWISVIVLGSLLVPKHVHPIVLLGLCLVCTAHLVLWTRHFDHFRNDVSSFTRELLPDGPDHTLGGLIYDYQFEGIAAYIHFPSYYTVWEQGIATSTLTDYQSSLIRRRMDGDGRSLPVYEEWVGAGPAIWKYGDLDYVLVRGDFPEIAVPYMKGFSLVKQQGKWSLYERQGLVH